MLKLDVQFSFSGQNSVLISHVYEFILDSRTPFGSPRRSRAPSMALCGTVRGLVFDPAAVFPFLGIRIVLLVFEAFGWILLTSIMFNTFPSISLMPYPAICFLCIPSGPEAVFCLVRFRHLLISRTVIAWNTSPISRALQPKPVTEKGTVIFGVAPHRDE